MAREIAVEIQSLAPGGDAVGRQSDPADARGPRGPNDGRVTFVPLAAPGERVRARLEREKGRVAWAELTAVERTSAARVAAPCPLFGACGGCQWQHVSDGAQREAKKAIVERALGIAIEPVVEASGPFGYRDRAKLVRGAGTSLGFRARRSHAVVDVPACPLFGPELARALPALRAVARRWPAGTEVELQAGAAGVHVNVASEARVASNASDSDSADLHATLSAAGVVGLAMNGRAVWGEAAVDVAEPGGPPLWIPAGGFAQVGRAANAALVAVVNAAIDDRRGGVIVELYAGSGNFTRHLVPRAETVYAGDANAAAVERGRRNAPGAHWAVGSARAGQLPSGVVPDVVVLDPPREGADASAVSVARQARRRIVYVSCDPQTLARDVRLLRDSGFQLRRAVALDLMPQTFHVEVVAELDRG